MEVSKDHERVVCKQPIRDTPEVILREKGSAGINKASKERNDSLHCTAGQHVHQACRKNYCAPNQIAKILKQTVQQDVPTTSQQILGSAKSQFNYSCDCFYCGEPAKLGRGKVQMFFQSEQLKLETQFWECVKKGGINGQMLSKQEFYMFMICMPLMRFTIKHVVSIFVP